MHFVPDANIFIYSIDANDPAKHDIALRIVRRWLSEERPLPRQVIGELLNWGHKRGGERLVRSRMLATQLIDSARIVDTTGDVTMAASDLAERHLLQYWDALICAVAAQTGAMAVVSEDTHDGLRLGPMRILNPFNPANAQAVERLLA